MPDGFSCLGAGYNKSEYDGISFHWVGESYLLLHFLSAARVGSEITHPGGVMLYAPGELRDYGSCGGFVNSYCTFNISREIMDLCPIRTGEVFYPENTDTINRLLKKIADEQANSRPAGDCMLLGLMVQLLAQLSRAQLTALGPGSGKETKLRRRFEKLREEYLSDLANPPDIDELINREYFSRAQFYRLYKRFFGSSPKSDLLAARLSSAKDLLIKTRLSTAEVAALSGFGSPLALYRAFKAHSDCTVKEWRAAHESQA